MRRDDDPSVVVSVAVTKRRTRRRFAFFAVAVLAVASVVECLSCLAFWIATGSMFSWARAEAVRTTAAADMVAAATPQPAAQAAATAGVALHPYLGFVVDAAGGDVFGHAISRWGFVDDASPLRRADPQRFVVGLTGGSVALQLALYASGELATALKRSPALAGRQVDVVRLAVGGWKQPQQLFAVQMLGLLGGHFDAIVDLDGFNEVTLAGENVPLGVPAWFPRSWARLADQAPGPEQLLRLGELALLREQRERSIASASSWWWSPTAQFVFLVGDRRRTQREHALRAAIEHAPASFAVTGPGVDASATGDPLGPMVEVWANASAALHAYCKARGIAYCHFLQPNQYVAGSKPIGPDEAKVALAPGSVWERGVASGYPRLRQRLDALRGAGVPVVDLTAIFAGHEEALYVDDCCHLGPRGNAILAEHVAAGLRRQLESPIGPVRSLRIAANEIAVGPARRTEVRVAALDEMGASADVTGIGHGSRVEVEPADLCEVSVDGALRALRRGRGTVAVHHAGLIARGAVVADWPDLLVGDDGRAGPGAPAPAIAGAFGPGGVRVQITGLPAAPVRILVAGDRPLPPSPVGADVRDLRVVPLPGDTTALEQDVPVPPVVDRPLFVRVYAMSADARTVVAATPTLVVTRR